MKAEEIIQEYLYLKQCNAEIESRAKRLKAANTKRMDLLAKTMTDYFWPNAGGERLSTAAGVARKSTLRRVKSSDWLGVYDFICQAPRDRIDILQKRLHGENTRQAIGADDMGVPAATLRLPPGFEVVDFNTTEFTVAPGSAAKAARETMEGNDE